MFPLATMQFSPIRSGLIALGVISMGALCQTAAAASLCVNPGGTGGCYKTIQAAVGHASAYDVIHVHPGTYKEFVTIGIPLSVLGDGAGDTIIDATGLAEKPDGNNVNVDREARMLAENAMRFNVASALLREQINTVKEAIQGGSAS